MKQNQKFQAVLAGLLERGAKWLEPFGVAEDSSLTALCDVLLSSRGEASGVALAGCILDLYREQDNEQKLQFFLYLSERYDPQMDRIIAAVESYGQDKSPEALAALNAAVEPPRQELLRRINQSSGGTAALVSMRSDLLPLLKENPTLQRVDNDFAHLLGSWFNRGFLQMKRISWSTPADILEKIIDYEAVHEIPDWNELRRRLQPSDRRCYAFFHPAMPDEPLVFVEVALSTTIADDIVELLSDNRKVLPAESASTAVFYSISNCQAGLRGVSFGNFLIKQVVNDLLLDLPDLKTFITLSPAPGFAAWLQKQSIESNNESARELLALSCQMNSLSAESKRLRHAQLACALAAQYFLLSKRIDNSPPDPVARFHLGNGAELYQIHPQANITTAGLKASAGLMVNYQYDLTRIEENHEAYAAKREVRCSRAVRSLLNKKSENNPVSEKA